MAGLQDLKNLSLTVSGYGFYDAVLGYIAEKKGIKRTEVSWEIVDKFLQDLFKEIVPVVDGYFYSSNNYEFFCEVNMLFLHSLPEGKVLSSFYLSSRDDDDIYQLLPNSFNLTKEEFMGYDTEDEDFAQSFFLQYLFNGLACRLGITPVSDEEGYGDISEWVKRDGIRLKSEFLDLNRLPQFYKWGDLAREVASFFRDFEATPITAPIIKTGKDLQIPSNLIESNLNYTMLTENENGVHGVAEFVKNTLLDDKYNETFICFRSYYLQKGGNGLYEF